MVTSKKTQKLEGERSEKNFFTIEKNYIFCKHDDPSLAF